jgi:hypothetical protein
MPEISPVLLIIIGYFVILFIFFFISPFIVVLFRKDPLSTKTLEEMHDEEEQKNWRVFKWWVVLPSILWTLAVSFYSLSRTSPENIYVSVVSLLLMIIKFGIWTYITFSIIFTIVQLILDIMGNRNNYFKNIYKSYRIKKRCSSGGHTLNIPRGTLILAPLLLISSYFFLTDYLLPISLIYWHLIFAYVVGWIKPAKILLLGKSRDQILVLQSLLGRTYLSANVVSLLNINTATGFKYARSGGDDVLRALPGEDWKDIVKDYSVIVKIIVLDVREISRYVEDEICMLSRPEIAHRTVIIHNNNLNIDSENNRYKELIEAGAKMVSTKEMANTYKDTFGLKILKL